MLMLTFSEVPRDTVVDILLNKQRAIVSTDEGEPPLIGDVIRLVSDEADVHDRIDCLRAVSHVLELPTGGRMLSLRPLATFDKDALK